MDLPALATPVYVEPSRYYKRRLTQAAYDILSDFFYDVSSHPTAAQCQALTDTIRQLPECEWYTVERARSYFYQKRYHKGLRVKPEPMPSPPLPPARLPADLSTLASPKMTPGAFVSEADDGAVELVRSPARKSFSKARKRKEPMPLLTTVQRPVTATQAIPATHEKPSPTFVEFDATLASTIARPQLYYDPFRRLYAFGYASSAFPHSELHQPYAWHYPSTPAPPLPIPSTCPGPPPVSILPPRAVLPIELRLHDLAAQLAHALTDAGPTPSHLPTTPTDLMRQVGKQQASEDFLRAVRSGAYARLGLLPFDAFRMPTPLALTH